MAAMTIPNSCQSSGHRHTCLGGEVAPPLDVVPVIPIAWGCRRQQHHAAGGRHPRCTGDRVVHRPSKLYRAEVIATLPRWCPRLFANSPAAVAEADDGLDCAGRKCREKLAVVETAVVATGDQGYVAAGVHRQRRQRRLGDRRNTVVDKKNILFSAELLLPVRQAPEVARRPERGYEVDVEDFCNGECCAQIRSIMRSGEVGVADNSDPIPAVEYRAFGGMNSGL